MKKQPIRTTHKTNLSTMMEKTNKCLDFSKKICYKLRVFISAFIIIILLFLILWVIDIMMISNKFLDPFERAFLDFQYTDIFYSQIKKKQLVLDTNIVLVNIGDNNRQEIAREIEIIQSYKPKVIGLDIIFRNNGDTAGNAGLNKIISTAPNIVLARQIVFQDGVPTHLDTTANLFKAIHTGHVNFPGQNQRSSTIREFQPIIQVGDELIPAFTIEIIKQYNPEVIEILIKRGYNREIINYSGTLQSFPYINETEIISQVTGLEVIKDKIVLLGYFNTGRSFSFEDKYFTPFNEELSGRSWPDMYGIVIHANILSMIIRGDYIYQPPVFLERIITFIISYLFLLFFIYLLKWKELWYIPFSLLIQLVSSIVILYIIFNIYSFANLKFTSTLLIVLIILSVEAAKANDFVIRITDRYINSRKETKR